MDIKGFLGELRRRNVVRVAIAYAAIAWLVIQLADFLIPALQLPEWTHSLILLLVVIGAVPALVFSWAFELTPEGLKRTEEVDPDLSVTHATAKRLDIVTLAALVVVAGLIFADRMFPEKRPGPGPDSAAVESDPSIAVLPFADLSAEGDQEYFADGVSEEILNTLAKIRALKVAGRTSSFAFKGRNEDLRVIGQTLGVRHILEGSVRKSGNRVRITAQLIKAEDGFHLWSETYDRELDDIFAVQDELAAAIVSQLRGSLLGDDTPPATHRTDVAVYDRYLAARHLINQRSKTTLEEAQAILEDVVAQDANFAVAHAALAETFLLLRQDTESYGDLSAAEAHARARPLVERALELDPGLGEAYAVLGLLEMDTTGPEEAIRALKKAIELNPSLPQAYNWLYLATQRAGRPGEALRHLEEAVAVDPLWLAASSNLAGRYRNLGEDEKAWDVINRLEPFYGDSPFFLSSIKGQALEDEGRLAEAIMAYGAARDLDPATALVTARLANAYYQIGEGEKVLELMAPMPALQIFAPYVTQDWEPALPGIEQMLQEDPHDIQIVSIYVDGLLYLNRWSDVVDLYDGSLKQGDFVAKGIAESDNPQLFIAIALALKLAGREGESKALLDQLRRVLRIRGDAGAHDDDSQYRWATIHAVAGETDEALASLERAIDKGFRTFDWTYAPEFAAMEGDPRFAAIQERMQRLINEERAKLDLEPLRD